MPRPFLTAVWSDLIIASYAVPDDVLLPYLRPGLTLDRYDGSAWCSIVAFDFRRARVLGLSAPFQSTLRDFPEVNLRLYAREGDRRGVVFIKELAPNAIVTGIAHACYNEPYSLAAMRSRVTQAGSVRRIRHDFHYGGCAHHIAASGTGAPQTPRRDIFETWVKEQTWGFGRLHSGRATRYRVTHPEWRIWEVAQLDMSVATGRIYGPQWTFLQDRRPDSVVMAEGSAVAVYPNEPISD